MWKTGRVRCASSRPSDGTQPERLAAVAEMMLPSFALAARINTIRAEKEKAQQAAQDAHAELVVDLRESEQILETRVAE